MNTEIVLSNPATIQAYFEKVRQLAESGEPYPADLNEIWSLIYSEKGTAIRALRKNFFEDEDYISLDQNVKRATGGTVVHTYRLTVPCMEYFIARKVREVFDVYRQVFHRVADQLQAPAQPDPLLLIAQMLQQQTQLLMNNQQQISQLQQEVDYIKATGQRPPKAPRLQDVSAEPSPTPPGVARQRLVARVSEYAGRCQASTQEVWRYLYKRMFEVYSINPRRLQQQPGESMLASLERYGYLDKLDNLIRAELDYADE